MKKNKVIKMNGLTNEERQEEEEIIGLIRRDEPKLIPCQCNNCGAIFLMKNELFKSLDEYDYSPCPNCKAMRRWKYHTISPLKYKFLRYWRMRDGEA